MSDKCPKCGGPLKCLAGESAHPNNWFCEDEKGCGWLAWEKETNDTHQTERKIDEQQAINKVTGMYYALKYKGKFDFICVSRTSQEFDEKIDSAFWKWKGMQARDSNETIDVFLSKFVKVTVHIAPMQPEDKEMSDTPTKTEGK